MFKDHPRTSSFNSGSHFTEQSEMTLTEDLRRHLTEDGVILYPKDSPTNQTNGNGGSSPQYQRPSPPLNGRMVLGGVGYDRTGYDYPRDIIVSRRDTARRNLMGHLYTRQPALKRSYSFVAGERPSTETLLPQLSRREKYSAISFNSDKNVKPVVNGRTQNGRNVKQSWQSDKNNVAQRNGHAQSSAGKKVTVKQKYANGLRVRPGSNQVSLPELINDINISSRLHSPGDMDDEDSSNGHGGDGPLALIRSMDMKPTSQERLTAVKHRPITPGVIDKLNKLKLSTKLRTEQWVKTLPLDYRAAYSEIADDARSEHSAKDKEWIYTTT